MCFLHQLAHRLTATRQKLRCNIRPASAIVHFNVARRAFARRRGAQWGNSRYQLPPSPNVRPLGYRWLALHLLVRYLCSVAPIAWRTRKSCPAPEVPPSHPSACVRVPPSSPGSGPMQCSRSRPPNENGRAPPKRTSWWAGGAFVISTQPDPVLLDGSSSLLLLTTKKQTNSKPSTQLSSTSKLYHSTIQLSSSIA